MSAEESYETTTKDDVPVRADEATVEDTVAEEKADSNEQLEKDEADAIDKDNIIDERTRGAAKDTYREPGDDEGLPTDE